MIHSDFEAIIFDCDGTLVDSEPITVGVLIELTRELGLKIDYEEALGMFVGRDMPAIGQELGQRLGRPLPEQFVPEFRNRQAAALRRDLRAIEGAADLLSAVETASERQFCLASNAPRDKIAINLSVSGLGQYFPDANVFSAYDIQIWKPQPDLFLHAATSMGVSASRCVVIEDSVAGFEAALSAGMQVIGYAASPADRPTDRVPFVHSLRDLIDVLA